MVELHQEQPTQWPLACAQEAIEGDIAEEREICYNNLNPKLMTLKALLFLFIVFTYAISCSSSRKTSASLDLGNLSEVIHFINSTTPCEQISYIEANKEQIVRDTNFAPLIFLNITKGSKRKLFIPVADDGSIVSTQFQTEFLQEQLDSIKLELKCK